MLLFVVGVVLLLFRGGPSEVPVPAKDGHKKFLNAGHTQVWALQMHVPLPGIESLSMLA
jgi:hypothetical protein